MVPGTTFQEEEAHPVEISAVLAVEVSAVVVPADHGKSFKQIYLNITNPSFPTKGFFFV